MKYSRSIKHYLADRISKLFDEPALRKPLFMSLPIIKSFIDSSIFFNKLSHLYFNVFNKLKDRHFALKHLPSLMGDNAAESTVCFEIFIRELKSSDPKISLACAKNLSEILQNYQIPYDKYGPLLIQQVVDILTHSTLNSITSEMLSQLKIIILRLGEVAPLNDYKQMIFQLFCEGKSEDINKINKLNVQEISKLIEQYEPLKKQIKGSAIRKISKSQSKIKHNASLIIQPSIKEVKLIKPKLVYYEIQKIFIATAFTELLFSKIVKKNAEYVQEVLNELESLYDESLKMPFIFSLSPKNQSKLFQCSHFIIEKFLNHLNSKQSNSHNFFILKSVANTFVNLLYSQKIDKQTIQWEIINPSPCKIKIMREFRPKGQCVATLYSNNGKIKVVTKGADNFFYSGSDKGEIRVYNFDNFSSEKNGLVTDVVNMNNYTQQGVLKKKTSISSVSEM